MAIEKKLIHFGKLADFEIQLNAGNILDRSIVFIQDAKKIWTHGTYYDCSENVSPEADNVYITDFTVNDLQSIAGQPASSIQCQMQHLYEAVVAHKLILVPYDIDEGFQGYGVAVGYREDLLYLTVFLGAEFIDLELNPNVHGIDGGQVVSRSWSEKQDALVSGTNIKTINGTSLLGSGDIVIQGGSGTITEVKANGTSVATSGVANIPAASTSAYGVTKLSSATNSTSTSLAATASAVKAAYDLANGRQPKLVSGNNIKTINGTSILGSGNIEISGGSKTYVFDWGSGFAYSGTISAEEFAEMIAADTIIVKQVGGMMREADSVTKVGSSECSFTIHTYASNWIDGVYFVFENNGSSDVSWTATQSTSTIPTKTSDLTNDSNFVSSTNLKTVNGESILGSGNITISSSGVSEDYVNTAIANAITTTLNTAV